MLDFGRHALVTMGCAIAFGLAVAPVAAQNRLEPRFQFVLGDGSVLPGDGSVMPGDGSVLPAQIRGSATRFAFSGEFSNQRLGLSFQGASEADPFIDWSLSVTNLGGNPLSMQFTFGQPTIGGPYDRLVNSLSASLTDRRDDGASLTGLKSFAFLDGALVPTSVVGGDCVAGPGATSACPALPALQYGPSTSGVPALNYVFLSTMIEFTLSPGDRAIFSGSTVLDAAPAVVPLPASLPLLIAGLAIGAIGWRRRSA